MFVGCGKGVAFVEELLCYTPVFTDPSFQELNPSYSFLFFPCLIYDVTYLVLLKLDDLWFFLLSYRLDYAFEALNNLCCSFECLMLFQKVSRCSMCVERRLHEIKCRCDSISPHAGHAPLFSPLECLCFWWPSFCQLWTNLITFVAFSPDNDFI